MKYLRYSMYFTQASHPFNGTAQPNTRLTEISDWEYYIYTHIKWISMEIFIIIPRKWNISSVKAFLCSIPPKYPFCLLFLHKYSLDLFARHFTKSQLIPPHIHTHSIKVINEDGITGHNYTSSSYGYAGA